MKIFPKITLIINALMFAIAIYMVLSGQILMFLSTTVSFAFIVLVLILGCIFSVQFIRQKQKGIIQASVFEDIISFSPWINLAMIAISIVYSFF